MKNMWIEPVGLIRSPSPAGSPLRPRRPLSLFQGLSAISQRSQTTPPFALLI
jgi:hypothetical protein